jgi:hypothetical protein
MQEKIQILPDSTETVTVPPMQEQTAQPAAAAAATKPENTNKT